MADLLADMERYRLGFPVLASPDSHWYRASRFVSRYPLGVSSAATVVLIIIGLSIVLAIQARRAKHEAASADAVSDYLVGLFDNSQPDTTQGRKISARDLLDQGTLRLTSAWHGEPLVKAHLLSTLGSVYYQLGDFNRARDLLTQAKVLYQINAGAESEEVADLDNSIGEAELDGGDYVGSLRDYSTSVRIFEQVKPGSAALADAMDGLSGILWKLGRYPESEFYHRRSITLASSVLGPDAPMTLVDKNNYAVLLLDMGRWHEAEALHREVLAARIKRFGLQNSHTCSSMCNLGSVLLEEGKFGEARMLLEASLHSRQSLYPGGHPNIGISLYYLSLYHLDIGDLEQAHAEAEQALRIAEQFDGPTSLDTVRAEDHLGMVLLQLGETARARTLIEQAMAVRMKEGARAVPELSASYDHLGLVELAEGHTTEATAHLRKAFDMRVGSLGPESNRTAESELHLGRLLRAEGKPAAAVSAYRHALLTLTKLYSGNPHPLLAQAQQGLGEALNDEHSRTGAVWIKEALKTRQGIRP